MSGFNLKTLARPNIQVLEPYRCARDDYKEGTLLDANENTFGPSLEEIQDLEERQMLNRYPDPHQLELKAEFCKLRNKHQYKHIQTSPLKEENLCLGVGSDESIDALIRIVCVPGSSKLLTCPPTYGMYSVSAQINDVSVVKVSLDLNTFQLRPEAIRAALTADPTIKLAYFCSPGNPTGQLLRFEDIEVVLNHPTWNGLVVVDEAYIDFAALGSSMAPLVTKYPNLVVIQTLSKSFGLAGIRIGVTFADPAVARLLNNMKAPYNISTPSADIAARALTEQGISNMYSVTAKILAQRSRLVSEVVKLPGVNGIVGGLDANFVLVQFNDKPGPEGKPSSPVAAAVYKKLAEEHSVVVRFRGHEPGCEGCLRISIGTESEIDLVLKEVANVLQAIYRSP